jgi:hypothetical protein
MDMSFESSQLTGHRSATKVSLHIERLVVDASLLPNGNGRGLQAAIETELANLVREHGLAGLTNGTLYQLPARDMKIPPQSKVPQVGEQIARTVHTALSPESGHAAAQGRHR